MSVCVPWGTYTRTSTARRPRVVADARASLRHACDDDDDDDEDDDDGDGWRSIRAPRASSREDDDDDDDGDG